MTSHPRTPWWKKALFAAAAVACAGPWSRTDAALLAGIVLALAGLTAWPRESKTLSKWLIQASVVALGLRLNLHDLGRAAADGLALAVGTIVGAMAMGLALGALLRSGRDVSLLVSTGTAICGGSAIAAVGSAVGAAPAAMAVSTAAIFILNAVGLWCLPPIGHALQLTDAQFGTWAGVALHDIASVGGAAGSYHAGDAPPGLALDTANVVKMTRVVWIVPIALAAGWWWSRSRSDDAGTRVAGVRGAFPWFVLGFLAASAVRTFVHVDQGVLAGIASSSRVAFQLALFLIGSGLSLSALREVGWRAVAHAAILWVVLATASLLVIRATT